MTDMLAIAQSGVRAYARALDAVADNVANAATPGHVRRTANLAPASLGGSPGPLEIDPSAGNGVRLTGISRAIDLLGADTLRRAEGDVAALGTIDRWLTSLQSALTGANSLGAPFNELFAGLSDLANDPANPALRQTLLAKAATLADRFNRNAADLDRLAQDLAAEAETEVDQLASLANGLADLNAQLRRATRGTGASVTLADERDRLLARMAQIVAIDVHLDPRGQAEVRIPDAGGPSLVSGARPQSVRVVASAAGFELRLGPSGADEPAVLTGGTLAGLSAARTLLAEARTRLDELAERFADDMNDRHQAGIDLDGEDGEAIFGTRRMAADPARGNAGGARLTAALADGAPPPPALQMRFDGTQWTLERPDLSAAISGTPPLALDGVTVEVAGAALNGDLVRLVQVSGAAGLALRPLGPRDLAAAPRYQVDPDPANRGAARAEIRPGAATGLATPPVRLVAPAGGTLELRDSLDLLLASGVPGDWLAGDGFEVRLLGTPADGDLFRIGRSGPDSDSNGNMLDLLSLREDTSVTGTLGEAQDAMVAGIAVPLAEARARADAARANRDSAAEALTEASGVDLNSEAAEMLRFQQAFSANARVIQAARDTFEAILAAAR